MTKPVRDIMTKEVITIDINQGVVEAAQIMADKHISSVVVVDKEQPIGIITERDFVKKICSKELEISKVKVSEVMSRIRTYADPETSIDVAIQRMLNHNIRRLPILSEGKVIGIITVTDLAKHLRTELLLQGALLINEKSKGIRVNNDSDYKDKKANIQGSRSENGLNRQFVLLPNKKIFQ